MIIIDNKPPCQYKERYSLDTVEEGVWGENTWQTVFLAEVDVVCIHVELSYRTVVLQFKNCLQPEKAMTNSMREPDIYCMGDVRFVNAREQKSNFSPVSMARGFQYNQHRVQIIISTIRFYVRKLFESLNWCRNSICVWSQYSEEFIAIFFL